MCNNRREEPCAADTLDRVFVIFSVLYIHYIIVKNLFTRGFFPVLGFPRKFLCIFVHLVFSGISVNRISVRSLFIVIYSTSISSR